MFGRNTPNQEGCRNCDEYSHGRADAEEDIDAQKQEFLMFLKKRISFASKLKHKALEMSLREVRENFADIFDCGSLPLDVPDSSKEVEQK